MKCLKRNKGGQNEINMLLALKHDNIVDLVGHKVEENYLYLALTLCTGSADDLLAKYGKFGERTFGLFLKDVSAGLRYLYGRKIFHRDIKPDNILYIAKPKKDYQFLIGDFGLATMFKDYTAKFTQACGTFDYMHPDVLGIYCRKSVQYGIEADIHSLAVTIFEVVTNELPFKCKVSTKDRVKYAESLLKIIRRKPEGHISKDRHGYQRYFTCNQHELGNEILAKLTEILLSKMMSCEATWDEFFKAAENVYTWALQ